MKDIWQAIFSAGKQTDAAGNTKDWTEQDLDFIAQTYNEQDKHEAPIVIGHPKTNAPAYGWIEKLQRKGDTLYAKYQEVAPEFTEWVKKGFWKKVSIALYPNMTLRHVGFLGAEPPAIKGLPAQQFAEGLEFNEFEFVADGNFSVQFWKNENGDKEVSVSKSQGDGDGDERSYKSETKSFKIKDGDKTMPEKMAKELIDWAQNTFSEETASKITEKIVSMKPSDKIDGPAFAETPEIIEQNKRIKALEFRNAELEFNEYCNSKKEVILPVMKPALKELMLRIDDSASIEFAEGDGTAQVSQKDLLKKFIGLIPPVVNFKEFSEREINKTSEQFIDQTVDSYNKSRGYI
jgi:hypothetical protein